MIIRHAFHPRNRILLQVIREDAVDHFILMGRKVEAQCEFIEERALDPRVLGVWTFYVPSHTMVANLRRQVVRREPKYGGRKNRLEVIVCSCYTDSLARHLPRKVTRVPCS